ncbi:MAG: 2-succinyl-5-enolpyruvyl-6-hydroxy-3-cyclohexene-1-carboxylic-acid synthase [Paludibacteraceae bacterium]|nr:2-succinyl-5-enolpyruvyl-6-hydroxy-3-cyclohexene-1-carboxylic-acid synthase [Paludibacteraceae bacterium]
MFSVKKNVLQLVALMRAFGIKDVVLCPGSRNSPLTESFAACVDFRCHPVTDERSAGFQAIGIIEETRKPVAVCCTSGTALLNLASAVAEAYYQHLPLLVISADRPTAWIGQMDGQTICQPDALAPFVRKRVNLPEINTDEDAWFCNRLINEALLCLTMPEKGSVHINVPISEPLFDFSAERLPEVRKIDANVNGAICKWQSSRRPMLLVGQHLPDEDLPEALRCLCDSKRCVVLGEHLANVPDVIGNFDDMELTETFAPDFLITIGGHVVSKKLKRFLRTNPPSAHWHISADGAVVDTFKCLTDVLACSDIPSLLISLSELGNNADEKFMNLWKTASAQLSHAGGNSLEEYVTGELLRQMPENSALQLANSSAVRLAQRFALPLGTKVYCNRGTNGIDGSLSAAVGYANVHSGVTFLVVGDLSFFYDMNALISLRKDADLHVMLLNNGGGKIFEKLFDMDENARKFVAGQGEHISAKKWAETVGMAYMSLSGKENTAQVVADFVSRKGNVLLEVNIES